MERAFSGGVLRLVWEIISMVLVLTGVYLLLFEWYFNGMDGVSRVGSIGVFLVAMGIVLCASSGCRGVG